MDETAMTTSTRNDYDPILIDSDFDVQSLSSIELDITPEGTKHQADTKHKSHHDTTTASHTSTESYHPIKYTPRHTLILPLTLTLIYLVLLWPDLSTTIPPSIPIHAQQPDLAVFRCLAWMLLASVMTLPVVGPASLLMDSLLVGEAPRVGDDSSDDGNSGAERRVYVGAIAQRLGDVCAIEARNLAAKRAAAVVVLGAALFALRCSVQGLLRDMRERPRPCAHEETGVAVETNSSCNGSIRATSVEDKGTEEEGLTGWSANTTMVIEETVTYIVVRTTIVH